jgi:hypothetical protein
MFKIENHLLQRVVSETYAHCKGLNVCLFQLCAASQKKLFGLGPRKMKEGQSSTDVALFKNTQLCVSVVPILVPCQIHQMLIVVHVQSLTTDQILLVLYDIYIVAFGFVGRTVINGGIQPMPVRSWWCLYWYLRSLRDRLS